MEKSPIFREEEIEIFEGNTKVLWVKLKLETIVQI